MKKLIIILVTLFLAVCGIYYYAYAEQGHCHHDEPTEEPCEGKHCNGTVGCDCPGFSPITNGEVWQQSYCKYCGHHKRYHK